MSAGVPIGGLTSKITHTENELRLCLQNGHAAFDQKRLIRAVAGGNFSNRKLSPDRSNVSPRYCHGKITPFFLHHLSPVCLGRSCSWMIGAPLHLTSAIILLCLEPLFPWQRSRCYKAEFPDRVRNRQFRSARWTRSCAERDGHVTVWMGKTYPNAPEHSRIPQAHTSRFIFVYARVHSAMFGHWPPVAGRGALHRFTIQLLLVLLPERNCLFLGRRFDNPTKFSLSLPTDVLQSWLCLYAWWAEVIHQNAGTGKTCLLYTSPSPRD